PRQRLLRQRPDILPPFLFRPAPRRPLNARPCDDCPGGPGADVLTGAVELFLISLGLTYFMATTGAGLRVRLAAARPARAGRRPGRHSARPGRPRGRRAGARPGTAAAPAPGPAADPAGLLVYYLIPCLDEAAVIEGTVAALLADPRARVVV